MSVCARENKKIEIMNLKKNEYNKKRKHAVRGTVGILAFEICTLWFLLCPARSEGAISVAFVRPSVRLSVRPTVAHIANNSRTQRPSAPPLMRLAHQFQGQKVKGQGLQAINAHRHRAPYLLNGKTYELQTWYTDGGRRPASATGATTSKVKGQRRKVT